MDLLCAYESLLKALCKATLPLNSLILFTACDPVAVLRRTPRRHSPGTSPSGWCPALGTASGSAHPHSLPEGGCRGCREGSWPRSAPARRPSRSGPELQLQRGGETRKRLKGTRGHRSIPLLTPGQDLSGCRPEARCIYTVNVYHQLIKNAYLNMGMNYDTTLQYRDK